MSRYLVTLKPIEAFFFGGERTFEFIEKNGDKKKNEKLRNNIIVSSMFPQQTSILGMLRKEVLQINGLIQEDWDYKDKVCDIKRCIGNKGFDISSKEEQSFGVIKKISPVMISQENESNHKFFLRVPKDHDINKKVYTPFNFYKSACRCNFSDEIYLPLDYKAKDGMSNDFINIESGEIVKSNSIFKEDSYIGIKLNDKKTTEEKSLFRLKKYRFNYDAKHGTNDKAFAFTAEIDDDFLKKDIERYNNIVSLGGESSYFYINFEKVDFDIVERVSFLNNYKNEYYKKIVLLSDTYINSDTYQKYCKYSMASTIDFRTVERNKYEKIKGKYYNGFDKIKFKYSFLERGSVLFIDKSDYDSFIKKINNKNLKKIGYNIFV